MNTSVSHVWKRVVVTVLLMWFVSLAQASETTAESREIILSATVRDPPGITETFGFSFEKIHIRNQGFQEKNLKR